MGEELDKVKQISNPRWAGFFDIDDNGSLDILVSTESDNEIESERIATIDSFYNNFLHDAYTLKAVMTNGYSEDDYSSVYHSANFKITITELDTSKHELAGAQQPHSTYINLETPYVHFGLGRTNNYVEDFYSSAPLVNTAKTRMWSPIIPNSFLIVIPSLKGANDW
eukprot:CAMPEP_0201283638 /NCGR_PEP_ID=MMETSP1317-20130820/33029_1 /ASSEMBLY_ACC=CAM_ASM_000770 /TAXON_ID=187299 /ORGANISM="Undescribed Undescribed, Strain Undescribed" /LENGTH=166 /DNA_ID=CAMNT_0047600601 /DNA_START=119 /DNA_END=616 /DNA_ORIENTATION=-